VALRRGPPLGARRRRPARALAESDDQAAVRQSIDELQQLGAAPAAAIVARRLRERGVRGVRADRVHARVRTRPARPASPPASSRCWRCSPRGCATSRSHSAWSCPKRRSTTPSPRRCESSMCAAVLSAAEALRLGLTPRGESPVKDDQPSRPVALRADGLATRRRAHHPRPGSRERSQGADNRLDVPCHRTAPQQRTFADSITSAPGRN